MEFRASHILVKDQAAAERLYERVRKGESFASLAHQYSTCPSKSKGGDLGWFGPGQMVKEFEDAAFAAPKGAPVGPVRTQFGYHIILVTDQK